MVVLRNSGFMQFLHQLEQRPPRALKKDNAYLSVDSGQWLHFRDALNYTAGVISLRRFLKENQVPEDEGKLWFW